LIKFDETGNIIYKKITQSSGNQTYDEYCLLAISKATPLPKVPEKFSTVYRVDGVVIGFPD
ncbi:MAG: TonB C-terminal domain-containing protein, partial [Moraxellaceae bacterium]|nr:TonB C-terminal domain-containing protein [Pseudobdellovibrionaceae bacterium]